MLKLRMLVTKDGSLNGRDVRTYAAGEVVDLPDQGPGGLADVFLTQGWAERVSVPEVETPSAPEVPPAAAPPEVELSKPRPTRRRK